jgi:serine/threonine protein kinase
VHCEPEAASGKASEEIMSPSESAASETMPTEAAPSCPPVVPRAVDEKSWLPTLAPGERIDDYEVLRLLGSGGFARVYLARQVSLDRLIALKVSRNQGNEARTLARLEHHHIVQVFSELVDAEKNLRLLCMQFVPGVTLARVIAAMVQRPPETWSGHNYLLILDELCTESTAFDLSGLGVRALLESCDHAELTCWIGARLAEALAHAHSQGVIHRDIKPANVLVNRYGRPLLADFNIAHSPGSEGTLGGTLAHMAPEHLDAFNPTTGTPSDAVDERSDLYSLGVMLFELLTGRLPFTRRVDSQHVCESLRELAAERRVQAPSPRALRPEIPELLDRQVRRCLDPEPEQRFASAADLMRALDGCRELRKLDKMSAPTQPESGRGALRLFAPLSFLASMPRLLGRLCQRWPFAMLPVLALFPNMVGSFVNILYNHQIIADNEPAQQRYFANLVLGYNVLVYPVATVVFVCLLLRVQRAREELRRRPDYPPAAAARCRRQALALPGWVVFLACLGWFPGGLIFPVGLHVLAPPLPADDFLHLLLSFVLSGLIALTYSYFGAQFVVLRVLYPQLWSDPANARETARQELRLVPARLRLYQFLAVLIPLTGAALLIGVGPDLLSLSFRLLVTSLMVVGLAGFALAATICNRLEGTVLLLTGTSGEGNAL